VRAARRARRGRLEGDPPLPWQGKHLQEAVESVPVRADQAHLDALQAPRAQAGALGQHLLRQICGQPGLPQQVPEVASVPR
jgi:hypothetical protein